MIDLKYLYFAGKYLYKYNMRLCRLWSFSMFYSVLLSASPKAQTADKNRFITD